MSEPETPEEAVRRIAKLARIAISDEEVPEMVADFKRIIGFIDQLKGLDLPDIEPGQSAAMRMRPDAVTDGNCREAILANAPEQIDGYFAAPKVIE